MESLMAHFVQFSCPIAKFLFLGRRLPASFVLKDPFVHRANFICKGVTLFTHVVSEFYVGETKRNTEVR